MKTSKMELNMDTVEKRKYEEVQEVAKVFYNTTLEYKEIDKEFDTDKGHKTFQSKEEREIEDYKLKEVPRPMLRDGCNLEEFKSFTLLWRLYAECHDGKDDRELRQQLLRCLDGPLEAAMFDALGWELHTTTPP